MQIESITKSTLFGSRVKYFSVSDACKNYYSLCYLKLFGKKSTKKEIDYKSKDEIWLLPEYGTK